MSTIDQYGGSIVKDKKTIRKFFEAVGICSQVAIKAILSPAVEPKTKPDSMRPFRRFVYNRMKKDFDVYIVKVERRDSMSPPVTPERQKKERVSKSKKISEKVPVMWTGSKASNSNIFSKKNQFGGVVQQPKRRN